MKKSRSPHTHPGGFDPLHRSAEDCERSHRRILRRVWIGFAAAAFGLAVMMWSADVISFEDERTIYTADCLGGEWTDGRCTGRLKAADRIRFRASKDRNEVVFWRSVHLSRSSGWRRVRCRTAATGHARRPTAASRYRWC
jgi:hypothetical protein